MSVSTFLILIILCTTSAILAQDNREIIGIDSMGWETQNSALVNAIDYSHEVFFTKDQLNKDLQSLPK
jgi:hypothetical protein|tara:strand:+ start:321 stop:524 length:204 start_codon:yes stop_codon:yes gene_type:complete